MGDFVQDKTGKYIPKPLVSLASLPKEEQDKFINEQLNLKNLPRGYTMDMAERLYKNRQFINKFGKNFYRAATNRGSEFYLSPEQRDEYFDRKEYEAGINDRFKNDPNLEFYQSLTTEGMKDLWNSEILSSDEISSLEKNLRDSSESSRKNIVKPKSKVGKFFAQLAEGVRISEDEYDFRAPDAATGIAYDRGLLRKEDQEKYEKQVDAATAPYEALMSGEINYGVPDNVIENSVKALHAKQEHQLEAFKKREDTRIMELPKMQEAFHAMKNSIYQDLNDGKATTEEISAAYTEAFDNDNKEKPSGSRYYTGYKNKSELSHIDLDYQIEKLAKLYVLQNAFRDSAKAMSVVDTDFFNDIKNNQNFLKRRWNTISGAGTKAVGMTANTVFGGFVDFGHSIFDKDPEEYYRYKTVEGDFEAFAETGSKAFLLNPNYWNYVDQYVTFSPNEIQRINHNGGIGGNVNLYSPTGKMNLEQFAGEAAKMVGYMVPGAVLSLVTKKVPRTSFWAKAISGWELAGSAAALGSAYSSGTYNKLLLDTQESLDKAFDAESSDFIEQYFSEHEEDLEKYLKAAGITEETNPLIATPYILAARHQMYEDAKQAYFDEHADRRAAYEEAEKQALKDAQFGAAMDDWLETGRMLISGAFWGKWSKSKLTRDLRNKNLSPILIDKTAEGTHAASQALSRNAYGARQALMAVTSGGVDNFLDDITADIGEGLGLGYFNNYIATTYNPKNEVEGMRAASGFLDGLYYGLQGAEEGFYDPQSWIDGAIGAAGTVLGTRLNAITLIHDAIKRDGYFSKYAKEGAKTKEEWAKMSKWQKFDRYISNGITTAMAGAHAIHAGTDKYIEELNKILPKYEEDIANLGSIANEQYVFNEIADNILAGKDVKQMGMLKSAIWALDKLNDPVISQIPEIKKFADLLNRGKSGNFTYAELQGYINDPNNISIKNAKDENGKDISMQKAAEAMQKNIQNFLKISDTYSKIRKGVGKDSAFNALSPLAKAQIATQLTLKDIWEKRLDSMQETLGTPRRKSLFGNEEKTDYAAEFGSTKGRVRAENALKRLIDKDTDRLKAIGNVATFWQTALENSTTKEEEDQARKELANSAFRIKYLTQVIAENKAKLNELQTAKVEFDESGNARTLSAEEIMRLSPIQRARMLNPDNLRDYSPEQQKVIKNLAENLKTHINERGESQDLYQMVMDAGIMQERLDASNTSIKRVVANPEMLQTYADRVAERKKYLLAQAAIEDLREEQLRKLDTVQSAEEAIDVAFRGLYPENTVDKGFYTPAEILKEYIQSHPDRADLFEESQKMVQTLEDLYSSADNNLSSSEVAPIKLAIAKSVRNASSAQEMISAVEDLVDAQTDATAKLQFDKVLEGMKALGYQRDATKIRDRQLERERKAEEETKRLEEEAKKDGKNYNWEGYKVGDVVYNKQSGNSATVVGFEGTDTMLLQQHGKRGITKYHAEKSKDSLTKDNPRLSGAELVGVEDVVIETPSSSPVEMVGVEEVPLEVDAEGKLSSPTVEQQAAGRVQVQEVPKNDVTEQGNVLSEETSGVISGNRWVTYSIESLKDGIVKEEVAKDPKSIFGRLTEWLHNNKIKLQEIIDEEFGRIITDNPDTEVKFMMMKQTDSSNPLQKVLFNVIELTPSIRSKYHNEERGGVIQANGKAWLVVGVTGFDSSASTAQMKAYDTMRNPISKRRQDYFKSNPSEQYYVDSVASTRVQDTTSGRIVNQRLGEEAPRLKKVSELLQSAGMSLRQAMFGIQTESAGNKSFSVTDNARGLQNDNRVFGPRNVEDNRGRTFVLIDTANGKKIPGMIEPAMYNELAEDSPLKEAINTTIAQLFSTNYTVREKAIKELCGYLVLGERKNILIGTKNSDVITIRREGVADITQKLGANFDIAKFFNDLANANFQVNITLKTLNNPTLLKMYDDSGALMTSVADMRTAGMSYTLYMTDAAGKPIVNIPVGNAVPGTGKSGFKTYISTTINNTTYEFKNGKWINQVTREEVPTGSPLEYSCIYNRAIQEGKIAPVASKNGIEYFQFRDADGTLFVVSRDGLGNVTRLSDADSAAINEYMQRQIEDAQRAQNLKDVNFDESPVPEVKPKEDEMTMEQVQQQAVGNFESPVKPEVKPQSQKEVIQEAKETQSQQPKEVITDAGTKSLTELQNTGNLSTFVDVATSREYSDLLYDVLEAKGWGVGKGTFAEDEEILKAHGVSVVGITNVEDWINQIRDCK